MLSTARFLTGVVRIGWVNGLIIVDFTVLAIFAVHVLRYEATGRSLSPVFIVDLLLSTRDPGLVLDTLLVFFLLTVIIPFVLGLGQLAFAVWPSQPRRSRLAKVLVGRHPVPQGAHLILAVASALAIPVSMVLGSATGRLFLSGGRNFAVHPSILEIVELARLSLVPAVASVLIAWLALVLRGRILTGKWAKGISTVARSLNLEYIPRHLQPVYMSATALALSGGLSPRIRGVQRGMAHTLRQYERKVPGSRESFRFARGLAEECRAAIRHQLLDATSEANSRIQLYAGTCRALESAIVQSDASRLVISPYEHPSELSVARWVHATRGVPCESISVDASFHELPWNEQRDFVVDSIIRYARAKKRGQILVLISEVCWATGLVIPVHELVKSARDKVPPGRLRFLIDGAHAVGNSTRTISIGDSDYYVFSGHKWLHSCEPSGVLVAGSEARLMQGDGPYDAWSETGPSATASVASLAGLTAALRSWADARTREVIVRRTTTLRNVLVRRVRPRLTRVGAATGLGETNVIALKPADGERWRAQTKEELAQQLVDAGLDVTVVSFGADDSAIWVRLAVPYFLRHGEIVRASRIVLSRLA